MISEIKESLNVNPYLTDDIKENILELIVVFNKQFPSVDLKNLSERLKTLKIDVEEFWILSSSALVLREIYPDAGDLDIAVTDRGLEELKKNYNLKFKNNGWFIVNDKIEGVCEGTKEMLDYQSEKIGEYYVQNINEYYNYLLNSDREKDKLRISIVEDYIKRLKK